jgi:orotate phosphoribosyltransferase-like protein
MIQRLVTPPGWHQVRKISLYLRNKAEGVSQSKLATELGVSRSRVTQLVEAGRRLVLKRELDDGDWEMMGVEKSYGQELLKRLS